ncbi:MAG: pentapeptide repeat-containing protein [Symploca sp. SIO2E9]|nr:pentapeptide repeat-containing protein [Symploca sp. SIO2E9]
MTTPSDPPQSSPTLETLNGKNQPDSLSGSVTQSHTEPQPSVEPPPTLTYKSSDEHQAPTTTPISLIILAAIALMIAGLMIDNFWMGIAGASLALVVSLPVIWPILQKLAGDLFPKQNRLQIIAFIGVISAIAGLLKYVGVYQTLGNWLKQAKWDEFGSWAEWVGALGQIMIAILAVYIAWRQYVISKDLTIQQNLITQQQTIDAYFQGISELALDDQGLLEDWPQERSFSEGRTAAILSSVDPIGKAKVLRFLSQSNLLTPLKRDSHLGRPILDGNGGYQEDREDGVRVIDLDLMLVRANLSGTDLRWSELSEANMLKVNLSYCNLAQANLSRSILYEANLTSADFRGTRLFYGSVETASPRSRTKGREKEPDYITGVHTGAVVENANFTGIKKMDERQHRYCCQWCGEKSRKTIPGGCQGIPNKLGH